MDKERIEKYLDRAKDLAEDAEDMAKHFAGEVVNKAKELTDEGGKVRELAKRAKDQSAAISLGAREKVGGIIQDAKAVKELKLAAAELETLPEDGSILYKMDLEAIINDMNKLVLFVTDNRLDDVSVAEEIRKVMGKVQPSGALAEVTPEQLVSEFSEGISEQPAESAAEGQNGDATAQGLSEEEKLIEKAKTIAYSACVRALGAINA